MINSFGTRSYWKVGFSEDQQKYYKEYRLSQKGIDLWKLIHKLDKYAKELCSIYDISYCCDESCCCVLFKHLPFQCGCNDNGTISSYVKGDYDFYDVEQIEEFVTFKGAYEILLFLKVLMMPLTNLKVLIYLNLHQLM